MQQSIGVKHFALNHLAGTALAFGILVSSLTAAATLSLTGDLPGRGGATSANVAPQASAEDAEQRQLAMERNEFLDWRKQNAAAGAYIAEQRQLRMERNEFLDWQKQFAPVPADGDASAPATAYDMEQRQLRMERDEYLDWQKAFADMR